MVTRRTGLKGIASRLLAGLALLLSASDASAQTGFGGIRGTLKDQDFGSPISGASVVIPEIGARGVADEEGAYFIENIQPGTYTVTITKEGFRPATVSNVLVSVGVVTDVSPQIEAEVVELDEFVVTSENIIEEESSIKALDIRQNIDGLADVLGADFIAKSGASDAGKLLTKVVGTSVVDGKVVVVRGLSDRYNTVFLNGARVPSSDPDRRAVNVDIFPGGLIETLVTAKTFTPNLPGEATGGHVDIILKGVPSEDYFKASVGLGWNTQATGNANFLSYRGGGVGMLGRANDRELPAVMKNSFFDELPLEVSAAQASPQTAAASQAVDPVFGVTTKEAPNDFSFSTSMGQQFEFFGSPLGIQAALTYKREYEFNPELLTGKSLFDLATQSTFRDSEFVGQEGTDSLLVALLLNAGWEATPNDEINATLFVNMAADDTAGFAVGEEREVIGDPGNDTPILEEEEFIIQEYIRYVERRLVFGQLTGKHVFPSLNDAELRWNANYGFSSQFEPDVRFSNYAAQIADTPTGRTFGSVGSNFSGQPFERLWRRLDDDNYSLNLATKVPFALAEDREMFLEFGGGFDAAEREYRADNFGVNLSGLSRNRTPFPETLSPDDKVATTLGDAVATELAKGPQDAGTYIFRSTNPEVYSAEQFITSAYIQADVDFSDKLNAIFGARIERTDISIDSTITDLVGSDALSGGLLVLDPLTGEQYPPEELARPITRSEVDVLPALSLTYKFAKDMGLRVAGSRTVARPTFKELAPVFTRSPGSNRRFFGNRGLELSDSLNADVRWEWFPAPGDVVAIGAFSKLIEKPIEFINLGNFATVVNEESAIVYGLELEVQKALGSIWPMLEGFSIGMNYSWIFSEVDLTPESRDSRTQVNLSTTRRLQGQPDYIFNCNVLYESQEWGLSAGLFLNVTGVLLYEAGGRVNNDFNLDILQQPFTTLDFTMSKKFGNFTVGFKAGNLLNAEKLRTFNNGDIFESYRSGTTYSVSFAGEW